MQIRHALNQRRALEQDAARLAVVDPEHEFPVEAPPEVRLAYAMARQSAGGPIAVRVEARRWAGLVTVRAEAEGDSASLVRAVRIHARPAGAEGWEEGNGSVNLRVPSSEVVLYYAVAIGPGGAPLASDGSASSPLRVDAEVAPLQPPDTEDSDDDGGGRRAGPWLWGSGAVVVAAGVVLTAVLLAGRSEPTQVRLRYGTE
jgi:hypothetical protein